jgi:hypothetical protein
MLPDHLCRRDVPGIDEAILIREYAQLEHLTDSDVLYGIARRKLCGAFFADAWYVEAPGMCEGKLSDIRAEWWETVGNPEATAEEDRANPHFAEMRAASMQLLDLTDPYTVLDLVHRYRARRPRTTHASFTDILPPRSAQRTPNAIDEFKNAYQFLVDRISISPEENAQLETQIFDEIAILNSPHPEMKREALLEARRTATPSPMDMPMVRVIERSRNRTTQQ